MEVEEGIKGINGNGKKYNKMFPNLQIHFPVTFWLLIFSFIVCL